MNRITILAIATLLLLCVASSFAVTEGVRVSTPDTCWYQGNFINMPVRIEWTKWTRYDCQTAEYRVPPPADPVIDGNSHRCDYLGKGDDMMCSFQMTFTYNPSVVQAVTVTLGGMLQNANWPVPYFEIDNYTGTIKIAGASGNCLPISGLTDNMGSDLVYVGFQVNGGSGASPNLQLANFRYNEVDPKFIYFGNTVQSGYRDARSIGDFQICQFQNVSGKVNYCSNGLPICGAVVTLHYLNSNPSPIGPVIKDVVDTTSCCVDCGQDARGTFLLTSVIDRYSYTLSTRKYDGYGNAITAFDASLILRWVVNQVTFTECQMVAADVSGDNAVTAYDASLILQFLIGKFQYFPKNLNRGISSNWMFFRPKGYAPYLPSSEEYSYNPLIGSLNNQNFVGLVLGDVSGNWGTGGSAKSVPISISSAIALGTTRSNTAGISLTVSAGKAVDPALGAQFTVSYPTEWKFKSVKASNSSWLAVAKDENGTLTIATAGTVPVNSELVKLEFEGTASDNQAISVSNVIMDEVSIEGIVTTDMAKLTLPAEFTLGANYPNPFNPSTTISFGIPVTSQVSISVFNVTGQKVRTLIDRRLEAGQHTIVWRGDDESGRTVASGVYFYRLETDQLTLNRKMVMLK